MICCKIVANYKQVCLNFVNILNDLNAMGEVLWDNHYFYFANTSNLKVNGRSVKRVLKKYGCGDAFLEEYGKDFIPQETDHAGIWIEDKLIKIGYVEFEQTQQDKIDEISRCLTDIEDMIEKIKNSSNTEDDNDDSVINETSETNS